MLFQQNYVKKLTLTLRTGDQTAVDLEMATAHSKSPLLDELEIIAEALAFLLKDKEHFTNSEKRKLSHVRNMTRHHSHGKN